jgi:TolC family type I secretion outer membrane protein
MASSACRFRHRNVAATMCALLAWSAPVRAFDRADPFAVDTSTARSPAAGVVPCVPDALRAGPLSLADVIGQALCNNPQTRIAWINARAAAAQLGIALGGYWPAATLTGDLARVRSGAQAPAGGDFTQRDATVVLDYLLYDFGARDAARDNAHELLLAANATQSAQVQLVFLAALQAYYQWFATRAAADAALSSEHSSLESFNAARARYQLGAATPADRLQAETAYEQAVLNRIAADGNAAAAAGVLANAMGFDAQRPLEVEAPQATPPPADFESRIDDLVAQARANRPDLAAAESQVRAAAAGVDAARAAGLPAVSVGVHRAYSATGSEPSNDSWTLGISVTVPLFTGFGTTYRVRAAQAQLENRAVERDQVQLQVSLDVWKAYQALRTDTEALRSSAALLASASESERVALGRYKAGAGSILDLLSAQTALANARLQDIQARYSWFVAKAALAQAVGRLDLNAISAGAAPAPSQH